jgi:hypothetical protein
LVPEPFEFLLLALGGFRVVRLISADTITEKFREWLTGWDDEEAPTISDEQRAKHSRLRVYVSTLIRCPWCVGFYLAMGFYGLWLVLPSAVLVACVPLALSALFGLIAKNLDD